MPPSDEVSKLLMEKWNELNNEQKKSYQGKVNELQERNKAQNDAKSDHEKANKRIFAERFIRPRDRSAWLRRQTGQHGFDGYFE